MKVQILITGQMGGSFLLAKKINASWKSTGFGNMKADFQTKGQARAALRNAYKSIVLDEPKLKSAIHLSIGFGKDFLSYDASTAEIVF